MFAKKTKQKKQTKNRDSFALKKVKEGGSVILQNC